MSFKSKITNIKKHSSDVYEITFQVEGEELKFTPGQFILIKISDEPHIMRAYSILRYNSETNEVSVGIKKVPNGQGTTIIFEKFEIGMQVELMGPMGETLIVDKSKKDIVLIATGIGITPIVCILEDLALSGYKGNVELIYGDRTLREMHYYDEVLKISENIKNINIIPVLSREEKPGFKKGYVTDVVKGLELSGKCVYMCSSNKVAGAVKDVLVEKGFNVKDFFCESA